MCVRIHKCDIILNRRILALNHLIKDIIIINVINSNVCTRMYIYMPSRYIMYMYNYLLLFIIKMKVEFTFKNNNNKLLHVPTYIPTSFYNILM